MVNDFAVAGDWHGDFEWSRRVIRAAAAAGADTILHVGDLGLCWPGKLKYRFDAKLDRYLGGMGVRLVAIVGNHDNHDELSSLPVGPDGLAGLRENIRILPRGGRFQLEGLSVGGLGGAFSVDWRHRTPGKDWWPGVEEVQPEDVDKLAAGGPVDVLLAHDAPSFVPLTSELQLDQEDLERANRSRDLLDRAVEAVRPSQVFCGHWHTRKIYETTASYGPLRVDVLHMQGQRWGNAVLMDPRTLQVSPLEVGP